VNTGNNLLFLVVSGLLAFMVITGYAGMVNIKALIPELLPPGELFAGSPARFRLLLKNEKRYIPSFLIRLTTPHGETLVPYLPAAASSETAVDLLFPKRGRTGVGRIRVSSSFPVNFFIRYWDFQLATRFIVYPRLIRTEHIPVADGPEYGGCGAHETSGLDGELERIRAYSGNEPLRAIHWKHSARSEELLVKQFSRQSAMPLIIRPDTLPGDTLEERLSRAAWLVRMRDQEQETGLILDGQLIQPASGHRHTAHLLTELALYGHD
jgi:uncharacterized protein (DUF58 family)